tara:strand:+ start:863 stop:1741 length:879 start_codon:yes stop_codon:yes gene_type:complete
MFKDNLDIKEYHQMEAINASFLITASKNCKTAESERKKPKKPTTRMNWGTYIHTAIQTKNMENNFYLEPYEIDGIPLRSAKTGKLLKKGEEQLEELKTQVAPKIVLSQKEWDMVEGCMENAWSHEYAKPCLEAAQFERSGFCTLQGIDVRARPDLDCTKKHGKLPGCMSALADIKTRQKEKADLESWNRDFHNNRTYIQAGLQMLVWETITKTKVKNYWYILCEVEAPYEVNTTYLDEELIEYSKDEAINAIEKWKAWTQNKSGPGYGKPQAQSLLPWKRREMEMMEMEETW